MTGNDALPVDLGRRDGETKRLKNVFAVFRLAFESWRLHVFESS